MERFRRLPAAVVRDFYRKPVLFRGGKFVHDSLRGRSGIGRSEDWPAHDEEIGACTNCFAGSCGACLIVIPGGRTLVLWADAGRDNQEIAPAGFANRARLLHGSNDAINPGLLGKLREVGLGGSSQGRELKLAQLAKK